MNLKKCKIIKIVLIFLVKHFEERDYERYGYYELKKMGYQYEVWSLTDWIFNKSIEYPRRMVHNENIINIRSKEMFDKIVNKQSMKNTFFIIYPGGDMNKITQYIKKKIKSKKGMFAEYSYPFSLMHIYDDKLIKCKSFYEVTKYYIKKFVNSKSDRKEDFLKLFFAMRYPSKFNFIQCETGYSYLLNKYDVYKKKTILLHTMDYDDYLRCNIDKKLINKHRNNLKNIGRYAVYIDEYLTGSSDFKKMNVKSPIMNTDMFFRELDNFFKIIEEQYHCEVVIALHPKSEYEKDWFYGRYVVEGDTALLVRDSIFCIYHYSTSFDYFMLYKKDFFQIVNDELIQNRLVNPIMKKWDNFGNKIINISNLMNQEEIESSINKFDSEKYKEYIRRYIKPEKNNKHTNMYIIGKILKNL